MKYVLENYKYETKELVNLNLSSKTRTIIDIATSHETRLPNLTNTRGPQYQHSVRYIQDDLDYFAAKNTYEALQEEKRRLRWLHILRYSSETVVNDIRTKISSFFKDTQEQESSAFTLEEGVDRSLSLKQMYENFAEWVSRGYHMISDEIHTLSYNSTFNGEYCPKLISDKDVNKCLNLWIEWN